MAAFRQMEKLDAGLATSTPLFKREQWQAVPWNLDLQILEMMLPRAADEDRASHRMSREAGLYHAGLAARHHAQEPPGLSDQPRQECNSPISWFRSGEPAPPQAMD